MRPSLLPLPPPWQGLPRIYYSSEDIYDAELEHVWRSAWLFACLECEIPEPGDFVTLAVPDPVLILCDRDGVRAFHNVCTHRGTVLRDEPCGRVGERIICQYHQWTFGRDGSLQSCRGMHDEVDRAALGLRPLHVLCVAGMVFVSLANERPDDDPLRRTFAAAEPHGFARAKVAFAKDYEVRANWKLVWENNRECYHCDAGHPQYVKANFDIEEGDRDTPAVRQRIATILAKSVDYWEAEGLSVKHAQTGLARFPDPLDPNPFPVSASRTILVEGFETESMDGARVAPLMGHLQSSASGVLRLRAVPNFWAHASCDHAVLTRLFPAGREVTMARVIWLVDAAAREHKDYSLAQLLPFWQLTSEQDWRLCELAARGVASTAYRPGPLSRTREYNVDAFFRWYLGRIR